ncbi:MAG TPA: cation:proton antiporter regulatory subunit [Nitriliruptorales bacterium]|nr:cation:proton antiporter regulatory subunit [Nitriliruptorales bacterium]
MMREVDETPLPGVGVRFSFRSGAGRRLSVVVHHTGRRDVYVQAARDPDASEQILELDEGDSQLLAELLGGSRVVHDLERLQHLSSELALDWLVVEADSPADQRSIGQLQLRSTTGVTVVAVLRDGQTLPTPGPDFTLRSGDTAVVVGTPANIRRVRDLLRP